MGLFRVACLLENQQCRTRSVRVPNVTVDTGSELTWINREQLATIGVRTEKRDRRFVMANGQVVFAEPGDLLLLGARTLEGLNMKVDSRGKRLVASGPQIAAGNVTKGRDR